MFSFFLKSNLLKKSRQIIGHYGDNLIRFLLDLNFQVGLINPFSTDGKRKAKTDKINTFIIAQVMQSRNYITMTKHKLEMKELTRYCFSLM